MSVFSASSATALVGAPAVQKKASSLPAAISSADSAKASRLTFSLSRVRPLAWRICSALRVTPEFSAPMETRLPARSRMEVMPDSLVTTIWQASV